MTCTESEEISNSREMSYGINKKFLEMHGKLREEYVIGNTDNLHYTTLYDDGVRGSGCGRILYQ